MVSQTIEGFWDDIKKRDDELRGRRVRLVVLDEAEPAESDGSSLAELMKDYIGSASSPEPHNDSERAEELWGQYVLEKHQKTAH